MVVGVALGVAVVIAIDLANTSASRAFSLSTEALIGRATHQIRGGPSGVPESFYRTLRLRRSAQASAPVVEGIGIALDLDQQPLRVLGIDPLAEAPFRSFLGGESALQPGFEAFYAQPRAVIVAGGLAERHGLEPGSLIRLQINDRIEPLSVLGVLLPAEGSTDPLADDILVMDVGGAQELFSLEESLSRIDLIATNEQIKELERSLPPGLRVAPASDQSDTASQLTAAFRLNLTALSLLALVVGIFLIYNTMMFSIIQRRRILGIQRALGVTPGQMFWLVLLESVAMSALGAGVGVFLGWLLGQGAVRLVSQTINDLYFVVTVRQASLTAPVVAKGTGLGICAGALAAVGPALEAARIDPHLAMQKSSLEQRIRNWLPWAAWSGVGLIGFGGLLLVTVTDSLVFSFAGMFLILIGMALLVPVETLVLMRIVDLSLSSLHGALGRLAVRTVLKELSRAGVAIAALMVALSVTIGVGVMIESFRATVANWLDLTLRADLYVSAPTIGGTRPSASLSPDLPRQVAQIPGVADVETFRAVEVGGDLGRIQLSVADGRRERDADLYRFAAGSPNEVWAKVRQGAVIVSEPFANRHDVPGQGGIITLYSDRGPVRLPVVGIYYDYSSDRGSVLMSDNVYRQFWVDESISSLSVYLADGSDIDEVVRDVRSVIRGTGLVVRPNRILRQEALAIFDRTFAITAALRVLAVVVAFIGVLSALLALQLERSRELATLRALVVTLRGLWRLTILETGLMGATAGLLSLPTGYVLALVLIYVINLRSFGWTIQMTPEPGIFLQAILIGVLGAVSAAVYPVYRLGRLEVAEALSQE